MTAALTGAERSKRYRALQHAKKFKVAVPISQAFRADLIKAGLLAEELADDRDEIARVLDKYFYFERK